MVPLREAERAPRMGKMRAPVMVPQKAAWKVDWKVAWMTIRRADGRVPEMA